MFKKNDPYSYSKFCTLLNNAGKSTVGSLYAEYRVTRYDDVQLNSMQVLPATNRKFLVHCTQHIKISNTSGEPIRLRTDNTKYTGYPVLLNTWLHIAPADADKVTLELLEYSPKTVNTKIQTSGSSGDSSGTTQATSSSNTVGSSTSETNSYGTNVSIGFGDSFSDPIQNASGNLSSSVSRGHSSTASQSRSSTTGNETSDSRNSETSSASTMSIKDWGAYAMVNPVNRDCIWNFAQEYPWDAIECMNRQSDTPNPDGQVPLIVPTLATARLYDGVMLYPPSHLSLFGVNFVMKALWLITVDNDASDEISLEHVINCFYGSHELDGNQKVTVYMDQQPSILSVPVNDSLNTALSLGIMALNPMDSDAVVGFIPSKFTVKPAMAGATAAVPFRISSGSDNLLVLDTTTYTGIGKGYGFQATENGLSASVPANGTLCFTLYFKIPDTDSDFDLYLKHWKTGNTGVVLTLVINGDTQGTITKYIDAEEAEGGERNLTNINLRNKDYASVDYHDYLRLGLNSIQISIQPIGTADAAYQLRALSLEKS